MPIGGPGNTVYAPTMPPDPPTRPTRWAGMSLASPLVMGILNVTPDSFATPGSTDPAAAIAAGLAMLAAGADIIDIGGESTRPGAEPVPPEVEIARVVPVVQALAAAGAPVSIDTRNAATMTAALDHGARIVNDVSALRHDRAAASLIATRRCPVVLMHMRGTPQTMNRHADYDDLVADILEELGTCRDHALASGIAAAAIALDPGFGFAKTAAQNITLLRALDRFATLGHPILAGVSRKRFIGDLVGEANPSRRDSGSIAAALFAARHGAAILRVHDVPGTIQALRVWQALDAI